MIWNGWELKKVHDLQDLLAFCMDFEPAFESLKEKCIILNEYITQARYPGDLPFESISQNDAKEAIEAIEAIEAANKIKKLVSKHINFPLNNK